MNQILPKSILLFLRIPCGQLLASLLLIGISHSAFAQSFTNQTSLLSNTDFHSGVAIGIADMNGDEKDDIIHLSEGKNLHVEYQQAANTPFTTYSYGDLSSNREWSLCIADADKNGYNDVLTGGAYNSIKLLKANATGSDFTLSNLPSSDIFLQGSNFVDIDNDGWVDVFACHDDDQSRSYRNTGNGNFVFDNGLINTALPSGNSGNYASIWTDYDNDGDLDMYLSKCRGGVTDPTDPRRINLLFQNDGTNNFTEVAATANLQFGDQSWSADFADIDNDGDLDFFVLNHYSPSLLMENNGDGTFTDITAASGMATDLELFGIQSIFRDFDNDGFIDLLVSGTEHRLFKNNGDKTFTNVVNPFTTDWIESFAIGDLNRDGFLDIYAGYAALFNTPTTKGDILFMNDGNTNNFFSVLLEGTESNINGIGARVELYGAWGIQIREVRSGEGYGIMNSFNQHFGLGTATEIDKIIVRWPSGIVDSVLNPTINQFFNLTENSTQPTSYCDALGAQPWQEWITNVTFGTIDNTSSKTPYGDYTSLSTDLSLGATYPISLSPGFSWTLYDEYFSVWIDWNQDNDFNDANELVFEGFGQTTLTGNIIVPASANIGTTRMRVAMQRDNYATSCGTFDIGEVEDYSVNIVNGGPILSLSCPSNITVTASGNATAPATWSAATATSTCTTGSINVNQITGPSSGSNFPLGMTTISYTATDGCNNQETCNFTVTVLDGSTLLTVSCPSNITITAPVGATSVPVNWSAATANSTCTSGGINVVQTAGPSSGSAFAAGSTTTIGYTAMDNCSNEETCSFVITILENGGPTEEYCDAIGQTPWIEWIENVSLNTINNTSAKERYGDFTDLMTNLDQGAAYDISLSHRFSWDTYDEYFTVWIDWNQDNDFTDAGEEVLSQISLAPTLGTTSVTIGGTINVPTTALTGVTRMRVAMKRNAYAGPCESFNNGEVEDYSINVVNNGPLLSISCPANISTVLDPGNTTTVVNWDAATATSTCTTGTVELTQTQGPVSGTALTEGSYSVTYEAVDDCENIETCSFTIVVSSLSSSLSILDCPININVTAPAGSSTALATWTEPSATTTCSDPTILVNQTIGLANGSAFPIGTTEVTYELSDNCGNLESCTFYINVIETSNPSEYCEAKGEQPWQEWISNVTFAGINNDSGKDLYGDYTAVAGNVTPGENYAISLQAKFSWTHHEEYFRVWIDYNQDGDFVDAGEEVLSQIITLGTPPNLPPALSGNITIPANATVGTTRMRVAMERGAYADPCGAFVFGEVEDYTIVINPLANSVIIDPVADFLRFEVLQEGRSVRVNWVTNAEHKNEYFELEHSNDGRTFELLKTVNSRGDTRLPTHYHHNDVSPAFGGNYYRLKEIYEDGTFKYSDVQQINFELELDAVVIYPNPAQEVLYVNLEKYVGEEGMIRLIDLLGQEVIRKDLSAIDSRPVQMDLNDIKNGMYTITIEIKDRKRIAKKVMISRLY